jgi:hypothetical protein
VGAEPSRVQCRWQMSRKIGGVIGHGSGDETGTFPDSQTAQQFSGWLYLEGYPDRLLDQNTVTVELPYDERDNIIEEAESRNGRVERRPQLFPLSRLSAFQDCSWPVLIGAGSGSQQTWQKDHRSPRRCAIA